MAPGSSARVAGEPDAGGERLFFVASCLSNQFDFPVDATLLPGSNRRGPSAKAINQMTVKPSSRSLSLRDSRSCARLRQRGHLFESHARRLQQQRRSGAQTWSASESETRQVAKDGIAGTKSLDAAAHGDHASGAASQVSLGRLKPRGPRIP
jgi:hypothetical protein